VRAVLANPGFRIKPGMLMTVRVESASRVAPAVPELAVIGDGAERFVYTIGVGNKAVRTPVQVGSRDAGLVEVKGLKPGQRVIGDGVVKVAEGTRVRIQGERGGAGGRPGSGEGGPRRGGGAANGERGAAGA
jgi:membrane fusion protein (multidrug efflux system)